MKGIRPRIPPKTFEDHAHNAALGLYILCGFLLLVVIILTDAGARHRAELNRLTKRVEALEAKGK